MKRYAVYYAPEDGSFADAAAGWLGWDPVAGRAVRQPDIGMGLYRLTEDPRKYGFHGTLKPPFRLADGVDFATLDAAVADLAQSLRVVEMPGLRIAELGGFLALVPQGDTACLYGLAAVVVTALEGLRAPLTDTEVARRRPESLTPRQRHLLDTFGYPYVMEEFRFHLTLSGGLSKDELATLMPLAQAHFAPHLPVPFRVAELCLFGEDAGGQFHLMQRYTLS